MPHESKREVSTFTKLSYGAGEFFNATTVVIILMLYLKFLTDVVGLSPFLAGICLVAGKAWDAVSDPLIGNISDRTRSRFGRRRVYFLIFAIPASLSFVSMWFFIGTESTWAKVVYYAVVYVLFKTLSSLLNVPYQALGPELARDYDERTSIIVFRMFFSLIGAIVAGVVPNILVRNFQEAGQAQLGHLVVSLIFGVIYAAIWFWIFAVVREKGSQLSKEKTPFFRSLRLTFRNRCFRVLVALYLGAFIAVDVLTASTKYFFDEYLRRPDLMPVIMGSMLGCATLSLPLYFWLIRRYDRKTSYMIGAVIWSIGLFGLFIVPKGSPDWMVVLVMVVIGIGLGAAFVTPWSMLPEVIDVEVVRTGRSEEGVYTGIMTFLRKASTTFALLAIATALEFFGYQPPDQLQDGVQPSSAQLAIRIFSTLIPATFVIFTLVTTARYPVTKRAHQLIRRRIEFKENAENAQALTDEENRELDQFLEKAYGKDPSA